jgi:hypothetical protein
VDAEAEQADRHERREAQRRAGRDPHALARAAGAENEERQRDPGRQLDAHARYQRPRGAPQLPAGAHAQRERQREEDQRVVVGPADRQHQQHRVQPDERARPARGVTEPSGRARDQRHRGEARAHGERLQHPQAAGEPQRGGPVAEQREQRPVGGVLERPSHEREDRIEARFGGDVRVGVKAMQRAHPRERQVAEHVLGDQWRTEQQENVRQHDGGGDRAHRQGARGEQHEHVARAHHERQRLKASSRKRGAEVLERAREPVGPAAGAGRDVIRGRRGGVGAEQKDAAQHAQKTERAEPAQDTSRSSRIGRATRLCRPSCSDPCAG